MWIRIAHYFADLTVVPSPEIQQEFVDHGIERVQVWQKGIDTDRFHPDHYNEEIRKRMMNHRTDDPFLLVFIGRVSPEKRIHDLKVVMDRLPANYHLCIVGSGPAETKLQKLFGDDPSTANRTTFMGHMAGVELSQAFASADLFVMPSDFETLGLVVLESMASGVPVIGVNYGGVKGSITDGVTGFLYEPNDITTFISRIDLLQKDTKLRTSMSIAGREECKKWSMTESCRILRTRQYTQTFINFESRYDTRLRKMLGLYKPTPLQLKLQEKKMA